MTEEMFKKVLIYEISHDYCENEDTIDDLINKFNKHTKPSDTRTDSHEDKLNIISHKIDILNDLLFMKKLHSNKADAQKLLVVLESLVNDLKELFKEAKDND